MDRPDLAWSVPVEPTALLDALNVAVIATDLAGTILECNRYAETLYAMPRDALVGASSADFSEDVSPAVIQEIGHALRRGETWEGDFAIRRQSGEMVMVHASNSAVFDTRGHLCGVVSASIDITDRWRSERRLAVQHAISQVLADADGLDATTTALLRVVCDELGWDAAGWWEPDEPGTVLRCSDFWTRWPHLQEFATSSRAHVFEPGVGLPGRVWQGRRAVWVPDVAVDDNFPRAREAAMAGLHAAFAVPLISAGGLIGVIEFFGSHIESSDVEMLETMASMGGHIGWFVERRRAETAIRAGNALRAAIMQSALDAVIAVDHSGRVIEFSPAAEQIFGYTRAQARGRPIAELIVPPELREAHLAGFERYLQTGEARILDRRIEIAAYNRAGQTFPVELTVTRINAPGPQMFTAHLRDISDRQAAERALHQSREQFASLARTLQQSLLPPHLPDITGIDLAALYLPMSSPSDVGGDFYDVFERARGDWILVVGDVCGKGAEAAAVTALARYTIRAAAMEHARPCRMLAMLNAALLRDPDARSCTAVVARIRRSPKRTRLTVACGGHPLPRLKRVDGEIETIGRPGTLLGVTNEATFSDDSRDLDVGDTIMLSTDGVTDARRGTTFFGEERLEAVLREHPCALGSASLIDSIERRLRDFTDGRYNDDIAVLVARRSD
jgi:PAS domain S-box-containing protein